MSYASINRVCTEYGECSKQPMYSKAETPDTSITRKEALVKLAFLLHQRFVAKHCGKVYYHSNMFLHSSAIITD